MFLWSGGNGLGLAVGALVFLAVITGRLITRREHERQIAEVRADRDERIRIYLQIDQERKEALDKANLRLDEQAIQIRELSEGQRTFNHFVESMRLASNLRKEVTVNEILPEEA